MLNKTICKVNCDVCDCTYNEDGCLCQKEEINVTNHKEHEGHNHLCGSYKKK